MANHSADTENDAPSAGGGVTPQPSHLVTESQWAFWLNALDLSDAQCLWRKPGWPQQRTYLKNGHIYKLYIHAQASSADGSKQIGNLSHEYAIIRKCEGISAVPRAVAHERRGPLEVGVYRAVDATSLYNRRLSPAPLALVLVQLASILARLSWRGVAHNDVSPPNVLTSGNGRCYLIDFDLAALTTRWRAFYHNFFRDRRRNEAGFYASLTDFAWMMFCYWMWGEYRRYDQWVEMGWEYADQPWFGGAARCARRAILMKPWRSAAWNLLWRALWNACLKRLGYRQK